MIDHETRRPAGTNLPAPFLRWLPAGSPDTEALPAVRHYLGRSLVAMVKSCGISIPTLACLVTTVIMNVRMKSYQATFLKHGRWWVGWSADVPGALTQGRTLEEAKANLRDAIRLMLEPADLKSLPKAKVIQERITV